MVVVSPAVKFRSARVSSLTLLISGLFLFGIAMSTLGFDINAFTTARYSTNVHEISDAFDRIAISAGMRGMQILAGPEDLVRATRATVVLLTM